jgi:hypothetical protein
MFAAIAAKWALAGGFKGVVKSIPRWVWITLAVIVLLVVAVIWHGRQVSSFETSTRADEKAKVDAAWQKRFDKERDAAQTWKRNYETLSATLAQSRSNTHEANLQSLAAVGSSMLVRGPGKAAQADCRPGNHSGVPAATGQPQQAASYAYVSGPRMSPEDGRTDRAVVPWPWLVTRTKEHDELLSEVSQWRGWHPEQAALLAQQKRLLEEEFRKESQIK